MVSRRRRAEGSRIQALRPQDSAQCVVDGRGAALLREQRTFKREVCRLVLHARPLPCRRESAIDAIPNRCLAHHRLILARGQAAIVSGLSARSKTLA